jgi:hypothetical protein
MHTSMILGLKFIFSAVILLLCTADSFYFFGCSRSNRSTSGRNESACVINP